MICFKPETLCQYYNRLFQCWVKNNIRTQWQRNVRFFSNKFVFEVASSEYNEPFAKLICINLYVIVYDAFSNLPNSFREQKPYLITCPVVRISLENNKECSCLPFISQTADLSLKFNLAVSGFNLLLVCCNIPNERWIWYSHIWRKVCFAMKTIMVSLAVHRSIMPKNINIVNWMVLILSLCYT